MIEQSEEEIISMAPATTDSQEETEKNENSFGIDNFLLTALESPRDRLTILKLDQELEAFVKDTSRTRLNFPPTSSYQRLIIHRVAQYFKIDHVVLDAEGGKRAVCLFKTAESRVPILRFTDLIEQPEGPPARAVKIMRRGQSDQKKTTSVPSSKVTVVSSSSKEIKDKTLEQREEEYAKARARIFGNEESQDASSKQVNIDQTPTSQKQMPKKEEQKTTIRPPQNDSFEYNRNADSTNWNRLWTPSPTDNYYNYEYYDMTMFNYRASYPLDTNHYANYLAAPPPPTPTPTVPPTLTTGDQNPTYQPLYPPPPPSTYIPPTTLVPPTKKSPSNQPKKTNETRQNMSPPSTPYYPSRPPPIIYSYPNEDMWSFYAPNSSYNPIPYVPTNEPNLQTYYYDRRPPKSTQLFDPNAPMATKKTSRPFSSGVLEDMRQMQNFPRSPSHESFFQSPQGMANPGTTTKPKEIQQIEVSQGSIPKTTRNESSQVEVGRLEHILEIYDLTSEEQLVQIEQSGAIMKRLDSTTIVAIYKTANAANEALLKEYSGFSLRRWKAPLMVSNVPTTQMTNLSIQYE